MSPKDIWLEYLGKKTGPCKGKGTQHLADRKNNIPGLAACLGSDFSMAVGTALAAKMRDIDQVTLFFVGEGACNEGDANPSMCMAALWNLPLVFAVCTNQFCEMGYMCEHYPTEDVAPRAAGYGIPYEIVDGQDIESTQKKESAFCWWSKICHWHSVWRTGGTRLRQAKSSRRMTLRSLH